MKPSINKRPALKLALVGISAATIECGKLALSALPNVEVVTLLVALYGYCFGKTGIIATLVFVAIEPLIYGIGSWVPVYFIYWPLLALTVALLGRARIKSRLALTGTALLMTVLFGVLSALVDVGLLSGSFDNFLYRFGVYYLRGIPFYLAQLATNAALFPLLFRPLSAALSRLYRRML